LISVRDRFFDLLQLSIDNPLSYYEPGYIDENKIDPELYEFLMLTEKVKLYFEKMRNKLKVLGQLHSQSLASTSDSHSKECRRKVTDVCTAFSQHISKARKILHLIRPTEKTLRHYFSTDEDLQSVRWGQGEEATNLQVPLNRLEWMMTFQPNCFVPAEIRMQVLQYNVRSLQLKEMGHKFFTMQKNYNEKSREKINRQISIIQGVMNQRSQREERRVVEEDAFSPDSEDERRPFLHPTIKDDSQVSKEMQDKLRNVHYFEREVYNLERNISKLYDSYLFVSNMVYDQGAMVDRVEHHINSSCDYVEKGTIGLKKAKQLRDKYRTKKVILTILVLVLIGLVILIIAMNMPHENDHKSEVATTEHHGSGH